MKNPTSSAAGAPARLASADHSAPRPRWRRLLSGTLVTLSMFVVTASAILVSLVRRQIPLFDRQRQVVVVPLLIPVAHHLPEFRTEGVGTEIAHGPPPDHEIIGR